MAFAELEVTMSYVSNTNFSNYNYLMKYCYSSNRRAQKSANRATLSSAELAKADAQALKKLTDNFKNLEYDTEHGNEIYTSAKAFIQTYNNLLESSGDCVSDDISRYVKKMKKLINNNKDALEEIGITVSSSGQLKLNKTDILESTPSKLEKVFGKDSAFTDDILSFSAKLVRYAKNLIHSEASIKSSQANDPLLTALLTPTGSFDQKA